MLLKVFNTDLLKKGNFQGKERLLSQFPDSSVFTVEWKKRLDQLEKSK